MDPRPSRQDETPSPTDTRHMAARSESGADVPALGLSESFQSTDTVRRRPDASSVGYGTVCSPTADSFFTTPTRERERERAHSRSATGASVHSVRSPALGPQSRPRQPPRKPTLPRRQSSQAPHRGGIFSVDDDPREVEADAAEQQQRHREQYSLRRRGPGSVAPPPLSRLQSYRDEDEEGEDERDGRDEGATESHDGGGLLSGSFLGPEHSQADSQGGGGERAEAEAPVEETEAEEGGEPETQVPVDDEGDDDAGGGGGGDDEDDNDQDLSDAESFTLKDRQQAINATHPFGIRLWKPALYKKDRSVQKTAEGDIHSTPGGHVSRTLLFFNILWTVVFGWWLAAIAALGAIVCLLFAAAPSPREYGRVLWGLAGYLFYPFGKFVRLEKDANYMQEDQGEGRSISEYEQWQSGDLEHGRLFFGPSEGANRSIVGRSRRSLDSEPGETDSLLGRSRSGIDDGDNGDEDEDEGPAGDYSHRHRSRHDRRPHRYRYKRRLFGRGEWNIGRVIFFLFFYSLIAPALLLVSLICWLLVFYIPMGKVTSLLFSHLRRHPLALSFESDRSVATREADAPYSTILLCTYRAVGTKYWKYTVDGTNIFLINLMSIVVFVILDYIVLQRVLQLDNVLTSSAFLFVMSLFSIIPLAYFIGQAVASISAQSSMGLGAAINALFSTVVEVFLYCVALRQGKAQLVEGSVVGSIFAGILFLPGLSMCFGAIKRKTQRFNAKSAGVTSTMLLFAVISAFLPTLFYQIYGTHEIRCQECVSPDSGSGDCRRCFFSQAPALDDRFYRYAVRPFCYFNATTLFLSYVIGLWFTLRTHAAVIWNTEPEEKRQPQLPQPQPQLQSQHHYHQQQQQQHQSLLHDDHGMATRHSQQHQHSIAELASGADVRDSQMYKRILGQSLRQVGLQPRPEDLTASRQGSLFGTGQYSAPPPHPPLTPHVVPAKTTTNPAMSTVAIPGLTEAENQILVREVAEMAATAATLAARDSVRRRPSGLRPIVQGRTPTFFEEAAAVAADAGASHNGHDAPNWSRRKSAIILLGATFLYAIIAEILVDTVDVVLEGFSIDEKFLGVTLFALVPNTTEFLNAISFAMNGNIALSMEIGSAYALQVCLLQIPALVLFSALYQIPATTPTGEPIDPSLYTFSLLFPQWDLVTVILCVFLLSYMYGEGKSNYFKGSILLLSYFVVVAGFFFSGFAGGGQGGIGIGASGIGMGMSRFDVLGPDGEPVSSGRRGGAGTLA